MRSHSIALRTVALACVIAAGVAATIALALPTHTQPVVMPCSEFQHWQAAYRYWTANLDDPQALAALDSNGNLIPCEQLSDAPGARLPSPDFAYRCDDFDYQHQAQWWYETWSTVHRELARLDGDRNGVACQGIPALDALPAVARRLNRLGREVAWRNANNRSTLTHMSEISGIIL